MDSRLAASLVLLLTLPLRPCHAAEKAEMHSPPPEIAKMLQGLIDDFVLQPDVVNYVALVDGGPTRWRWVGASGLANPETKEQMTVQHQFRIASVTKTFTAVVVLQLVEEGRFSLDSKLASLFKDGLPGGHAVNDLHCMKEKLGDTITVRQLLSHTSGLPDYFEEPAASGEHPGISFSEAWIRDVIKPGPAGLKDKQWSPADIVAYYFRSGLPSQAKFLPGNGIHYADTNFVLLAIAVEELTGKPLAVNYRERILDRLGMEHTYLEWHEPKRGDLLAHHFVNTADKGGGNIDVIAAKANTSADWAGGGLVSTVEDLNRFVRGLFAGKLFRDASSLAEMLKPQGRLPDGRDYALGIGRKTTQRGQREYWGHFGAWGVGMFYSPAHDVSVVYCRNQPGYVHEDLNSLHAVLEETALFR